MLTFNICTTFLGSEMVDKHRGANESVIEAVLNKTISDMESLNKTLKDQKKIFKSQFAALKSQMEQRSFVNDVVIFNLTIPTKPKSFKKSEFCLQTAFKALRGVSENDINYCERVSKSSVVVSFVRKAKKEQVIENWHESDAPKHSKLRHRLTEYFKQLIAEAQNLTRFYKNHLKGPYFDVDKLKVKEANCNKTHVISSVEDLENLNIYAHRNFNKKDDSKSNNEKF